MEEENDYLSPYKNRISQRKCHSNPDPSSIMLYKVIVRFLLIIPAVFSLSDEMKELAQMLHDTCKGETGATEEMIENARKGVFDDSEHLKCYIKCLLEQMACIDESGIIDVEATVAVLPEDYQEKVGPVIRKCGTKIGANPCENAWLTHKCYYVELPDMYFLP